ncbi:MAG: LCP family protein [Acidimicrobiia bacterium]|nr:LCP family protein [Acidimicrobiia bacterium]
MFTAAGLCLLIAGALIVGYVIVSGRSVVSITNPAKAAATPTSPPTTPPPASVEGTTPEAADLREPEETTTTATFPVADPEARNFLITGADNGACIDPDSPFAAAFGDRESMGERSDTIMIFRVDPANSRVAVLSFPRDLYVTIAGAGNSSRINSAYSRDEPQRLIDTIYENFGVVTDHFMQVDFCAFKTLVDSVGGVAVPFDFPARDPNTGLNVPTTGCFEFNGEHALAYVRSRKYDYEDPPGSGNWLRDPTSDLGRISRQQDFLRRTLAAVLDKGPFNPAVARGLIEATTKYVVTDDGLSPARLLEFAGVMRNVAPGGIVTYQIEATPRTINGAAVLLPTIEGQNMQDVLALFRGETSLEAAPDQVFEPTTTALPRPTNPGPDTTRPASAPTTSTPTATATTGAPDTTEAPTTTVPIGPAENIFGIVPPRDVTC